MCQKKLNFHLFQYNIKTIKDITKIKKTLPQESRQKILNWRKEVVAFRKYFKGRMYLGYSEK